MTIFTTSIKAGKVNEHVVETAVQACFACKNAEKTNEVVTLATEAGVPVGSGILAALQIGLTEAGKLDVAYETFVAARIKGYPIDKKDNDLLAACVQAGMGLQAAEILKTMYSTKEQYGLPDDETWSAAARAAAVAKSPQFLLDLIADVGDESAKSGKFAVLFYTHLICGAVAVDPGLGWDIYIRSRNSDSPGTAQHFHLIMTAFIKAKRFAEIETIYEDMKAARVLADEVTYLSVISCMLKLGNFEKANAVLQDIRKRDQKPTQQMYTLIFDAVSRTGDMKGSLEVLSQMHKDGIKPSVSLWTSLMRSTSRAIEYERANRHLSKVNDPIQEVSYKSLLNFVYKIRLGEYSTSALAELQNSGATYDENLANVMVMMADEDDGTNMEAILDQMQMAQVTPDANFFNFLMESAVKRRNFPQAKRIMAKMESLNILPTEITWNIYIKALGSMGQIDEILHIWNTKLIKRSLIDYNTILHQMKKCNRLDLVAKLFNEMNQSGIEANEITAGTLMQAYGSAMRLDHCFEIFKAFSDKYGTLSAVAYNILIGCCLNNKDPDKAVKLLDEMSEKGVQPLSTVGWDAATEGIKDINILEQAWDNVQKNPELVSYHVVLIKQSIKCNRPDLVQRDINLMHESQKVKWSDIEQQLSSEERSVLDIWVKNNYMSYTETDVLSLQSISKPRNRENKKFTSRKNGDNKDFGTTNTSNLNNPPTQIENNAINITEHQNIIKT
eukprot:Phypoly_transcript_03178.p1 GENE.Phypoly_transcript_03178~~Phypoly_transcript_03178.p1  ORF type:complete len:846 (+),score=108.32 Phypoly_transcript_03178:355-2538(+)